MSPPIDRGEVRIGSETPAWPEPLAEGEPLRILLLGNFSNRTDRPPIAERKPVRVDRDNFEDVLAEMQIDLSSAVAGSSARAGQAIRVRELDDFHPDRLYQRLDVFQTLRDLRDDLGNPARFEKAAARLRGASKPEPLPTDGAGLLAQMLGEPAPAPVAESDWDAYLRRVVTPHLVPAIDKARQSELVTAADAAIGTQMRGLLQHSAFRAIESAWRGVYFLIRRLDTDTRTHLHLLDVTREELPGLQRPLVERATAPWGVLVGLFSFGQEDAALLQQVGDLAQRAGAPFLAEADSQVVGCPSLAAVPDPADWSKAVSAEWENLRRSPAAPWLGLALPRFLLRLPYGKNAGSVEQFDFEEVPPGSSHEAYPWGNPAIACAYLLGEAYSRRGPAMRPGEVAEVGNLPVAVYHQDGETNAMPCAEVLLGPRATETLLDAGLMPLQSIAGRDAARLARFQSLAQPAAGLAGRWGA